MNNLLHLVNFLWSWFLFPNNNFISHAFKFFLFSMHLGYLWIIFGISSWNKNGICWYHHARLNLVNITNNQFFMFDGDCLIGTSEYRIEQIYFFRFVDSSLTTIDWPWWNSHNYSKGKPNRKALNPSMFIKRIRILCNNAKNRSS